MKRRKRARRSFEKFLYQIREKHPEVIDPEPLIRSGQVLVDGRMVTNPASLVRLGASIVVVRPRVLRGEVKLQAAFETFQVPVSSRVALDVGASAGGFTRADLVVLVKPMFELGLPALPEEGVLLKRAVVQAIQGIELGPWKVLAQMESPVRGAGGAIEFFLRARRVS